jgi:hypothetical protein
MYLSRYVQKKADEMKAISLQSAIDTVEKLEIKLTEFAKKHQSEIQNDPVFRQRYVRLVFVGAVKYTARAENGKKKLPRCFILTDAFLQ